MTDREPWKKYNEMSLYEQGEYLKQIIDATLWWAVITAVLVGLWLAFGG